MSTPRERFEELLPDYAEGVTTPAEVAEFEGLLAANSAWRADVEAERELIAGLRALPRREAPKGLLAESIARARAGEAEELGEDIETTATAAPRSGLYLRLSVAAAALFGIVWLGADVMKQSPSRTEEKAAPAMAAFKARAGAETDARVSKALADTVAMAEVVPATEGSAMGVEEAGADLSSASAASFDTLASAPAAPADAPLPAAPMVRDQARPKRRDWGDSQFAQMRQNELLMRLPAEKESQEAPMLLGKLEMADEKADAPVTVSALDSEGQLIAAVQAQSGRFLRIGNAAPVLAAAAAAKDKAAGSRAARMRSDDADDAPAGRVIEFAFPTRTEAEAALTALRAEVHAPWAAWLSGATIADRPDGAQLTIPLPIAP